MRSIRLETIAILLAGCATQSSLPSVQINVLDNVGGAAQASWVLESGGVARIEAASRVGDCVLQDFQVSPGLTSEPLKRIVRVEPPDEVQGGKAVLHLRTSESASVIARYVRTVLVETGSRSEPEKETEDSGSGLIRVGRTLSNGYRFDHYEFSTQVTGPGGASARVKEGPRPASQQAYLTMEWYYDKYSKVLFSWKIYATGPCDTSP